MNILLVLPKDRIYFYKGKLTNNIGYAPLTLTVLAGLVPEELNADIELIDEGVQEHRFTDKHYDIVGITCVASTCKRAYMLAEYYRSKGSHVVLGGVHPTLNPDEAQRHADTVIVGMGEIEWPRFLRDFAGGMHKERYTHNNDREFNDREFNDSKFNDREFNDREFLDYPMPRRDLQPKSLYMPVPTVIANRGCRNHCKFCSIHAMYHSKSLTRTLDNVVNEIKQLKSRQILFLDPSPLSDRTYAMAFFKAITPLRIKWMGLTTGDVVYDEELFNAMVESGCTGVLVGFETFSQENNAQHGKGVNDVERYREIVDRMHEHKISVLGHFVVGFDGDTKESLSKMVDIIDDLNIDLPRFTILTPLPGTAFYDEMKKAGRIITDDYDLYDTEHVVFQPKHMMPEELQALYIKIKTDANSFRHIFRRSMKSKNNRLITLVANIGIRFTQSNSKILAIFCNIGLKIYSLFVR